MDFITQQILILSLSLATLFPNPQTLEHKSKAIWQKVCAVLHAKKDKHHLYLCDGQRTKLRTWRDLGRGKDVGAQDGASYFEFSTSYGSKVHLIVIDASSQAWDLRPSVNGNTSTTSNSALSSSAEAAVNGGYFNPADGSSVSYVIIDGKEIASPKRNPSLLQCIRSVKLREEIYNRSEFRCMTTQNGKLALNICQHNSPVPQGFSLTHSLQAGPMLLPELRTEKELFIRTENGERIDVIRSSKRVARTAIGISGDNHVLIVCVEGADEEGKGGASLKELRQLMLDLGCSQALNLDGGSSSSMFVRYCQSDSSKLEGRTVCKNDPERRVKSVLLLRRKASTALDRTD